MDRRRCYWTGPVALTRQPATSRSSSNVDQLGHERSVSLDVIIRRSGVICEP